MATAIVTAAERTCWDVLVVGAGPAGATAAYALARRGLAVLLVDKAAFPRAKVCGCCLNGRALGVLEAIGLGDLQARQGAVPLRGVRLAAGGREAVLAQDRGVALSRAVLDNALAEAAVRAGAVFVPSTAARLGPVKGGWRAVHLRCDDAEETVTAKVVLAADGLAGGFLADHVETRTIPHSRLGAGVIASDGVNAYAPGLIHMACGTGGYAGLVRLEDGRLDVAAALDGRFVREAGGPGAAAAAIIAEAGLPPVPGLAHLPWRGTPRLTRRARRVALERVFVLGDAAGYVEPFTGEGIAWAVTAAALVPPFAEEARRGWHADLESAWARTFHRHVTHRQLVCRATAFALRRPWMVHAMVGALRAAPALAAPVLRWLNRPVFVS
jgi:flavin-dependent dehydrogenase